MPSAFVRAVDGVISLIGESARMSNARMTSRQG